jgi:predicted transcriptional regulator
MKNRSRLDIVATILKTTESGLPKTKIMINVGLSYYQLEEYLNICFKSNLLEYEKISKVFRTTDKGREFQKFYSKINDFILNESTQLKIRVHN